MFFFLPLNEKLGNPFLFTTLTLVKKFTKPLKESTEWKFFLSSKIFFKFFFGSFINFNSQSLEKVSAFLSDIFLGIPA